MGEKDGKMKAITIYQPWATLIAIGKKRFETRSWATKYRGSIAIHAGKKPFEETLTEYAVHADEIQLIQEDIASACGMEYDFDYGAIIAVAELMGSYRISNERGRISVYRTHDLEWYHPSDQEMMYGDWTPGRFAWELADVRMLTKPISCRGMQNLWTVAEDVKRKIRDGSKLIRK
jgi:hypothetical protein